jgi:hypothetical protein
MILTFRTQNYVRDKLSKKNGRHALIVNFPPEKILANNTDDFARFLQQLDLKIIEKNLTLGNQIILCLMRKYSITKISALLVIPYGSLYASVQKLRGIIEKALSNKEISMLPSLENLTPKQIGALPIADLLQLLNLVNARLAEAKTLGEKFDDGLQLRFSSPLQNELQSQSKDSGTVHFRENDFEITAEVPKKVTWDQEKMENLVKRIPEEQRKTFVKISYAVEERKYSEMPPQYRELFSEARTITPGKARFKITPPNSGDEA